MKTLILMRHAKSSWQDPDLDDVDRPLAKRGKRDAPVMGERLAERGIHPDLILTSPAKRARKTAQTVARALDYPKKKITHAEAIYEASEEHLLAVVQALDDDLDTVMLFGHNPGFTSFSYALTDVYIENIPTCGVVLIRFAVERWQKVTWGSGEFVWFDFPKNTGDVVRAVDT